MKGTYHSRLAAEAVGVYEIESYRLNDGKDSTIDAELENPDQDYLTSDDWDQDEAWVAWRTLTMKVTKLQALLDTRYPQFADGAAHLKSAQAFVARVDDADDWSDVPRIADNGAMFVEIALEAVRKLGQH
jgi:hypothetical protein